MFLGLMVHMALRAPVNRKRNDGNASWCHPRLKQWVQRTSDESRPKREQYRTEEGSVFGG